MFNSPEKIQKHLRHLKKESWESVGYVQVQKLLKGQIIMGKDHSLNLTTNRSLVIAARDAENKTRRLEAGKWAHIAKTHVFLVLCLCKGTEGERRTTDEKFRKTFLMIFQGSGLLVACFVCFVWQVRDSR